MVNLNTELTDDEYRALKAFLWEHPCSSGCAFEECQNGATDCDDCKFTKATEGLYRKLLLKEDGNG